MNVWLLVAAWFGQDYIAPRRDGCLQDMATGHFRSNRGDILRIFGGGWNFLKMAICDLASRWERDHT